MPYFSKTSHDRLSTCHPNLQKIFNEVILHFDCTVLCGHRDGDAQREAFLDGKSKLKWPYSKHNKIPSIAADVAPYPIDWDDYPRFNYFAGFVKGIAAEKKILLRWGGDWDQDNDLSDNSFNDLVHFELIE